MSPGVDPHESNEDRLYEQEDRWESRYADYLEEMIELQHQVETQQEYEASMEYLEQQMEAQANYDMAERYREGEELVPLDLGNNSFVSQMVREQMARRDNNRILESEDYNILDEELIQDSTAHQLLHLPMGNNDADAATVGEYLGLLLSTLWLQADQFSSKRAFGNSDWQYVVYIAMSKAGLADLTLDEDGYVEDFSQEAQTAADELILQAIKLAYNHEG